uniref:Reverse transcriptase zinc-binding domain-containing protein n=1 Tax=Quercus lobata TaxID=97700 RepID=A0A7N2QYP5_QUELO
MRAKWRVWDGQSIKVFEDKWLPGLSGGKVASVQSGLDGNLKVAALMSSDKACWNEQLSAEKNGIYVKSGYKLLCEEARREDASGSSREGMAELWSRIWKLKVPGKILHFLWKACTDCLPTKGLVRGLQLVIEGMTAYGSFLDLVELCLTKPGAGELFEITAWLIWTHRNKVRLREKTIPLSSIGEAAKKFLQQVKAARDFMEV